MRLYALALFLFIALPTYSLAAAQYSFSGEYELRLITMNNVDDLRFQIHDKESYVDMRFKLTPTVEMNENVKGVISLETGYTLFGVASDDSLDSVPGSDSINLKLKNVYVDFTLPNLESRFIVGLQPVKIFNGIIADEDAFGVTYLIEADRTLQINYVKMYDNRVNKEYENEANPKMESDFASIFLEKGTSWGDIYRLLFGYYIDTNASIADTSVYITTTALEETNDTMYTERTAMYFGFGYSWDFKGSDMTFDALYQKGSKKYVDDATGGNLSKRLVAHLIDYTATKDFGDYTASFEFLLATGDQNKDDNKDQEYMPVDGLTNFYDRAYILTGYISKDDSGEKTGLFDSPVYNLKNVLFFRIDSSCNFSKIAKGELAAIYAQSDERVTNLSGGKSRGIGTELDATISFDPFETYFDTNEGVLLNMFAAYFIPGENYKDADGIAAADVYLYGAACQYTF